MRINAKPLPIFGLSQEKIIACMRFEFAVDTRNAQRSPALCTRTNPSESTSTSAPINILKSEGSFFHATTYGRNECTYTTDATPDRRKKQSLVPYTSGKPSPFPLSKLLNCNWPIVSRNGFIARTTSQYTPQH